MRRCVGGELREGQGQHEETSGYGLPPHHHHEPVAGRDVERHVGNEEAPVRALAEGDPQHPVVEGLDGEERQEDREEDRVLERRMLALRHDDAGGSGDRKEQVQPAEPADEVHPPLP